MTETEIPIDHRVRLLKPDQSCRACRGNFHEDCDGEVHRGFGRTATPCQCLANEHVLTEGTCSYIQPGSASYDDRCDRRFTDKAGEITVYGPHYNGGSKVMKVCGMHYSARMRIEENDRIRREQSEARELRYKRRAENERSADDYCERLAELGIEAESVRDDSRLLVSINPEVLLGILTEVRDLLDDLGIDHPLKSKES